MKIKLILLIFFLSFYCTGQEIVKPDDKIESGKPRIIIEKGKSVEERFIPPAGYKRIQVKENSFAGYLRTLNLKPFNSPVHYFDGTVKPGKKIYISVVDMDIDKRDLQQCADAVMRLRAEYLYGREKYSEIHFNFISDGKPRFYSDYVKGDISYKKFRKYMRYIFSYANTSSLYDELVPVSDMNKMKIGDIFIQKGTPYGHAVIVVDMAESSSTGNKVYLLAQSYMPAQETQILINPMDDLISPWYELNKKTVRTPEWTFKPGDLRRFKDIIQGEI
ncbi:MAG: DUF4846 domain-containing protein [Acidobacteriota bacterium]